MNTIARHLLIIGEVSTDDDLSIQGRVDGHVIVREGTLTIDAGARVDADVRAPRVIVHGAVHGAISASERIDLGPTALVDGGLSADQITIAEGAQLNVAIDMGRRTIASRVAKYRAGRPAESGEAS